MPGRRGARFNQRTHENAFTFIKFQIKSNAQHTRARRVKEHCILRGLPWAGSPAAAAATSESEYYEDLLKVYRANKRVRACVRVCVCVCVCVRVCVRVWCVYVRSIEPRSQ